LSQIKKVSSRITFSQTVGELYDKISETVVQLLDSSKESFSIHTLSGIIHSFKINNYQYSDKTQKNIALIGDQLVQKYSQDILGTPAEKLPINPSQFFTIFFSVVQVAGPNLQALIPDLFDK